MRKLGGNDATIGGGGKGGTISARFLLRAWRDSMHRVVVVVDDDIDVGRAGGDLLDCMRRR